MSESFLLLVGPRFTWLFIFITALRSRLLPGVFNNRPDGSIQKYERWAEEVVIGTCSMRVRKERSSSLEESSFTFTLRTDANPN